MKATNAISGYTNTHIQNSIIHAAADVGLSADSTTDIHAIIVGVALSVSFGGIELGIGVALATNQIGIHTEDNSIEAFETRAYTHNTSIDAHSGSFTLNALSDSTVYSTVVAGSVAATGGDRSAGLGGSGSEATNNIKTWVQAAIDGSGTNGIREPGRSIRHRHW